MKSIFWCLTAVFLLVSCASYQSNIRHIRNNPEEIVEFKLYLEENYNIRTIDKYQTVWASHQDDTIIKNFCQRNNIKSIAIIPQSDNTHEYHKYGKMVLLYFDNIYFIEDNQVVVWDYTEKGLEYYDDDAAKHKIADRIFIFR